VASTIKIKRSSVAGKVPTTSDISAGELALNTKDQKIYSSNGTAVFQLGVTPSFGRIVVGSNTILATIANQSFSLIAGSGVTLAANPVNRTITISSDGGGGGGTGVGGYINSTLTLFPGTNGNEDLGFGESFPGSEGLTFDPFGVPLNPNFDCMDPVGSIQGPVDLN
jgi:hypothetical protein